MRRQLCRRLRARPLFRPNVGFPISGVLNQTGSKRPKVAKSLVAKVYGPHSALIFVGPLSICAAPDILAKWLS